ncbi:MAG: replication-relaxation family protein [Candidatus Hydrogenedentes bacterium]|nr:replication-relaxation family protein [Candidatus Hydrogenedentota bacterium]
MSTRITQASLSVLTDLADYRILSLSQVAHLHFGGKRAARRRMQQLLKERLVERVFGAPADGGGRPESIFGTSKAGLQLLQSRSILDDSLSFDQVGSLNLHHQIAHQLLLGWCRIHLAHLCRTFSQLEVRLLSFNSPLAVSPRTGVPIIRTEVPMDNGEQSAYFTPDAAFVITNTAQPKSVLFFLEVDMGTEPLSSSDGGDIRGKVQRYKQHFRMKGYKRYEKVWDVELNGFRLLFVTHVASTLQRFSATIKSMSPSDFVWLTSADRMFENGISDRIWCAGGCLERSPESILGGLARPAPLPKLKD